jgi:hypothetical protein
MSPMPPRVWWVAGALAFGCSCSPYGGGSFACTTDTQCPPNGICATGFCAFPDPNCTDSQFRYGEASGPNSGQCVGATNDVDASVDADNTPTPDGAVCYGAGLVHPCFASAPTGALTFSNTVLNTDTSTMCATLVGANANAWCVLAGSSITVTGGGFLAAVGSKPLVLVSTGTIAIQGALDVGSHRQFNSVGAAGNTAGCNAGSAPTVSSGGGGGSFGGKGGNGAIAGTAGTAGLAGNGLTVTALRGGCPGQDGSDPLAMGRGGDGGDGGGAVWLFAATSIMVTGAINASGAAGLNADASSSSGGGGGGAGGYIGLEAPSMTNTGNIFANGGGGGEASGNSSTGAPGTESTSAAAGGLGGAGGTSFGTDGGNGSVGATLTGQNGVATCTGACTTPVGGGGGGGGAGIIKTVPTITLGGNVSPPST